MVTFSWNCEIQLKWRYSVEMMKFSWNGEIQLKWEKEEDFYKVFLGV